MQTPLQITYRGLTRSLAFDALIHERVARLEHFHPRITRCRVVVDVPHRAAEAAKVPIGITVEVDVPGHRRIVCRDVQERREVKEDQTAALNNAFDAAERQLTKVADVLGGEVKQHEAAAESGVVVSLVPDEGYGFVEISGSPDLYFTRNAVIGGDFDDLEVGSLVLVTRATSEGPMGPQASSIRLLEASRSPP